MSGQVGKRDGDTHVSGRVATPSAATAKPAATPSATSADAVASDTSTPPRQVSDEEFAPERDRWTHENERLGEKFDTVIKSLQDAVADPFPDDLTKLEERLRTRHDELRSRISDARKAGKDMLIPALVLRQFPAKLMLAHATREHKDYEIARIVLEQAQFEIDEAINAAVVDVRAEVLRMAGVGQPVAGTAGAAQGTLKKEQMR